MSDAIKLDDVRYSRGGRILGQNISFTVKGGEKAVISGASGSGKSSLLMLIAGLFPPDAGAVKVAGILLDRQHIMLARSKLAMVAQEISLGPDSVRHEMLLPFTFSANHGFRPDEKSMEEALEKVFLDKSLLDARANSLSGGEQQRVAIARSLLLKRKIFLIDEPTAALDDENTEALIKIFRNEAVTVLSASHDPLWVKAMDIHFELANKTVTQVV